MSDSVIDGWFSPPKRRAAKALDMSVKYWFVVMTVGQWAFVYYLLAYYVGPVLQGGMEALTETRLPKGYVAGETLGNFAVTVHLFVAVIIIGFGPLQLIPKLRAGFPGFHRWNGRIYTITAILTSLAGLYMTWIRGGSVGQFVQHIAVTLNAVLIFVFAIQAWRTALARDFRAHQRWALRMFMAVSAVWLLRIGYQLWNFLQNGAIDYDPAVFQSDFFLVWNFGQYLLPLAVLELYLYVRDRTGAQGKMAMASLLCGLTSLMGIGIYAATFGMWLPRL